MGINAQIQSHGKLKAESTIPGYCTEKTEKKHV